MSKTKEFEYELIDHAPEKLADGVLYVFMRYAALMHLCACGCGREVVTPLDPTDYTFTFDGETVTLRPSVGNWRFPCRSHYFIPKSRVEWLRDMTAEQIQTGRAANRQATPRASKAPESRPERRPTLVAECADATGEGSTGPILLMTAGMHPVSSRGPTPEPRVPEHTAFYGHALRLQAPFMRDR